MPEIPVKLVESQAEWSGAVAVRLAVFVDEQGVSAALELDEHDPPATHAVALLARTGVPEATAVLRPPRTGAAAQAPALARTRLPHTIAGPRDDGDAGAIAAVVGT